MSTYQALPHAVALNARVSFFEVAKPRQSLIAQLRTALTVARTRRMLAKMDTAALADIGLTHAQARTEVRRGFWDIAPQCQH